MERPVKWEARIEKKTHIESLESDFERKMPPTIWIVVFQIMYTVYIIYMCHIRDRGFHQVLI